MKKAEVDIESQVQAALDLFPLFDIYEDTYKTVNDHPIGVHILVPKKAASKRPVLVKLHGGAFHEGASDLAFRPWTLELALRHNALMVTPDYRLMPESSFADMSDDLRDFWLWVDGELEKLPGLDVDTSNLAIVGESAGGYLTAQSVLLGFSKQAAVVMIQYPAVAIKGHLDLMEALPAHLKDPESILDDYLAKMEPGKVLTRADFDTRMDLARATMQSGRFVDLEKHPNLDPMTSLETAERIPPVFLFHALDDTYVSVEHSKAWVEKLKRLHPEVPVHAVFLPEGDHVLDKYHGLDEPWLKEPIAFVEQYWPVR